jgi:uncharacterized membrane protein
MKEQLLLKLKDKKFMLGVVALLVSCAGHFGLYSKLGIAQTEIQYIIDTITTLLVMLGIWNDTKTIESEGK